MMRNILSWPVALASITLAISVAAAPQKNSSPQQHETTKATDGAAPAAKPSDGGEPAEEKLPVRRVILYKTGVGYFEHLGHVRGNQPVRIDFTSSQLNDVLQSITILDLNGGRITGVNYNSEAPLSQRIGSLHLPLQEKTDVSQFYGALRGARLQIHSGTATISGRLMSVERKTRVSGGTTLEVDLITVVSDAGEVRSVELGPSVSVQLAEGDVTQEVSRYLHLLASVREQDLRRMTIGTAGAGDRQLYVSYISEVPIWKTTYRVVLPAKAGETALLQGWAIVDNTVGEDWSDVELSLVAGTPQSFIEQLSQPYYSRRPVVPLPESAQLTPQTHESAMLGGLAGLSGQVVDPSGAAIPNARVKLVNESGVAAASVSTDNQGHYEFGDLPAGKYQLEVEMTGFSKTVVQDLSLGGGRNEQQNVALRIGGASQTVTVNAEAVTTLNTEMSEAAGSAGKRGGSGRMLGSGGGVGGGTGSSLGRNVGGGGWRTGGGAPMPAGAIGAGLSNLEAAARGSDLGDLFQYKLKDRVTIHKNESALVPIIHAHVGAEKVSLWNASLNSPRPMRALWMTNSSDLTLDGGGFTVLEDEAFAGEGLIDAVKPGERRLASYAVDLGVRVQVTSESEPQRITHVRIVRGVMSQTNEMREETTYTIRDDDTTPRTVLIEHPLRPGWKFADDAPKAEETTSSASRFRVNVAAKDAAVLTLREAESLNTDYQLSNLDDNQIALFIRQKSINPEVEAAFRKIVAQKNQVAALEAENARHEEEKQNIYDDQQRLRENLKALKGSAEERALTQRYTQQLADQENRLQALEHESADVQAKLERAQAELNTMIEELTLDVTI